MRSSCAAALWNQNLSNLTDFLRCSSSVHVIHADGSVLEPIHPLLERLSAELLTSGINVRDFRAIKTPGPEVFDASTKLLVAGARGRPEAVLLVANPATPMSVQEGLTRTQEVADYLGPVVGSVVLQPLVSGDFEGRSYVVLPWERVPADNIWLWRAQKLWLIPRLLGWLRDVTRITAHDLDADQLGERVSAPLERLIADSRLPDDMRRDGETALARASSGQWRPKLVLAHDDLWKGNILLPRDRASRRTTAYGFHLIDWAGAQIQGFAFWDLAKLGAALAFPTRWAKREFRLHAELVGCEPRDALSYLLVGVADLGGRLEHMPVDAYVESSKRAHRFVRSGIAS
jgi:hypothetical protein